MSNCTSCSKELVPNAKFCKFCGALAEPQAEITNNQTPLFTNAKFSANSKYAVIGILVTALIGGLGYWEWSSKNAAEKQMQQLVETHAKEVKILKEALAEATKEKHLSTSALSDSYKLTAVFGNIGSLKSDAPVRSAGVVVGSVDAIELDSKTYEAKVTIKINNRYHFPKDTYANINTDDALHEKYVALEAGGDEEVLKNGDKIAKTQDAVVIDQLIAKFLFDKASESNKQK